MRNSTESRFNLLVYFEGPAVFNKPEMEAQLEEAANKPEGPAGDPMFADNMTHSIEGIHSERDNNYPHVRVELTGVGLIGKEATIVSSSVISKMEDIVLENTEGEHYTTAYTADCYKTE